MASPLSDLINSEIQILDQRKRYSQTPALDWDTLKRLGIHLGSRFGELTFNFVTEENRHQLDLPSGETVGSDLLSHLVKQKFEIEAHEEEKLCNSLENGEIINNVDPAKILHSFYRNFRSNRPSNYNATLFSLANSSF